MAKADLRKSFAIVLKELRKEAGFSQQELADYSDTERVYISRLECGIQMPSIETIFRISEALKKRPSEFVQMLEKKHKI
ncbi:hypothetical protein BH10BAC4_BH10BAC4_05620 [soil metagenome]